MTLLGMVVRPNIGACEGNLMFHCPLKFLLKSMYSYLDVYHIYFAGVHRPFEEGHK